MAIDVVVNSPAVSEFVSGQEFDCGASAVASMAWATKNDGSPSRTDTGAEQNWFVNQFLHRRDGGQSWDQNSNSVNDMRGYFAATTSLTPNVLHYQEYLSTPTYRRVVLGLYMRYPTIVTIAEDSVWDKDLGGHPYPWHSGHIFAIVGLDQDGDYLVFDTANMDSGGVSGTIRQWPRRYSKDMLSFNGYGVYVQLPWLLPIVNGDAFTWGYAA